MTITSNSKNPFEIRLELLKLAKEICDGKYWQEQNRVENLYNACMEKCIEALHKSDMTNYDYWRRQADTLRFPKPPDTDDIVETSEELKLFVDNKEES